MNVKQARAAIEAILDAVPDSALPKFDKVEVRDDGQTVVWWGSHGYHLGSATRNGVRNPENYRDRASWEAIEHEAVRRADRRFLENGDKADGLRLAKKTVRA